MNVCESFKRHRNAGAASGHGNTATIPATGATFVITWSVMVAVDGSSMGASMHGDKMGLLKRRSTRMAAAKKRRRSSNEQSDAQDKPAARTIRHYPGVFAGSC
nr:hypothetical protein RFYW14_04389 [Pseudorhizobium flavum]